MMKKSDYHLHFALTLILTILQLNVIAQRLPSIKQNRLTANVTNQIINRDSFFDLNNPQTQYCNYSYGYTKPNFSPVTELLDSIYFWHLDTISNTWNISAHSKITNYLYDANHNLLSRTSKNWNGFTWVNTIKLTYSYDVNNSMTYYLYQTWNSGWVNYMQSFYTYDVNNNMTSILSQSWNGAMWINTGKILNTYSNNLCGNSLRQTWSGSAWVNYGQDLYSYDANNNRISRLSQFWSGGMWSSVYLDTYTYNLNNFMTSNLFQHWDNGAWENLFLYFYSYDANNNFVSNLNQYWNVSFWTNSSLTLYTYDSSNNNIGYFNHDWNGSTWVLKYEDYHTYNLNNYLLSDAQRSFNSNGTISEGDSAHYYYHAMTTGVGNQSGDYGSITIYPNPVKDNCELQIPVSTLQNNLEIKICDIYGKNIFIAMISNSNTKLQTSNLTAGVYFVKVNTGKDSIIKKLIKE